MYYTYHLERKEIKLRILIFLYFSFIISEMQYNKKSLIIRKKKKSNDFVFFFI